MLKSMTLLYNGSKSSSLCFKPNCSIFNRPVFTLNHLNIPTVNQSKYLGIIISKNNCIGVLRGGAKGAFTPPPPP